MQRLKLHYLIGLLLMASLSNSLAATRYITDDLSIPLRDGTSPRHKILRMIKSGTAVEFVVKDKESGYSLIKVGKVEGWVPHSKLSTKPGAAQQLKRKTKALDKLKKDYEKLKAELAELKSGNADKSSNIASLSSDMAELQRKYEQLKADTADVVTINEQNKTLSNKVEELIAQRSELERENSALKDKTAKDWFIRGAAVVIAGILLGLIIPKLRFKRKDDWGSSY
jgi:SH3 domain protein